jgi:hypothetical protein
VGAKVWSLISVAVAAVGASLAKRFLSAFWRSATGKNPPDDPTNPNVTTTEAVAWALLSATLVAVVKLLASRRAASYYFKSTGKHHRP